LTATCCAKVGAAHVEPPLTHAAADRSKVAQLDAVTVKSADTTDSALKAEL
jgi:hypothetical protein